MTDRYIAKKAIKANFAAMIEARQNNDTPTATVNALVDSIGYDNAVIAVATLINSVSSFDGRVCQSTRDWANGIADAANAYDKATLAAETLGLDFFFTNAITQEYKFTGFTDAMGTFHESQFYKAFKNGGLFFFDELDASCPEVLPVLNAAIANRYFDFPAPIGYVEAHKDFRIIAAGNTFGLGADSQYVGRSQLDAATLDRFGTIEIGYCPAIEEACANGDHDLVEFCRAFRAATKRAGIQCIVSYRGIGRIAKMKGSIGIPDAIKSSLIRGMEKSDLDMIKNDLQEGYGEYSKAFKKILREVA